MNGQREYSVISSKVFVGYIRARQRRTRRQPTRPRIGRTLLRFTRTKARPPLKKQGLLPSPQCTRFVQRLKNNHLGVKIAVKRGPGKRNYVQVPRITMVKATGKRGRVLPQAPSHRTPARLFKSGLQSRHNRFGRGGGGDDGGSHYDQQRPNMEFDSKYSERISVPSHVFNCEACRMCLSEFSNNSTRPICTAPKQDLKNIPGLMTETGNCSTCGHGYGHHMHKFFLGASNPVRYGQFNVFPDMNALSIVSMMEQNQAQQPAFVPNGHTYGNHSTESSASAAGLTFIGTQDTGLSGIQQDQPNGFSLNSFGQNYGISSVEAHSTMANAPNGPANIDRSTCESSYPIQNFNELNADLRAAIPPDVTGIVTCVFTAEGLAIYEDNKKVKFPKTKYFKYFQNGLDKIVISPVQIDEHFYVNLCKAMANAISKYQTGRDDIVAALRQYALPLCCSACINNSDQNEVNFAKNSAQKFDFIKLDKLTTNDQLAKIKRIVVDGALAVAISCCDHDVPAQCLVRYLDNALDQFTYEGRCPNDNCHPAKKKTQLQAKAGETRLADFPLDFLPIEKLGPQEYPREPQISQHEALKPEATQNNDRGATSVEYEYPQISQQYMMQLMEIETPDGVPSFESTMIDILSSPCEAEDHNMSDVDDGPEFQRILKECMQGTPIAEQRSKLHVQLEQGSIRLRMFALVECGNNDIAMVEQYMQGKFDCMPARNFFVTCAYSWNKKKLLNIVLSQRQSKVTITTVQAPAFGRNIARFQLVITITKIKGEYADHANEIHTGYLQQHMDFDAIFERFFIICSRMKESRFASVLSGVNGIPARLEVCSVSKEELLDRTPQISRANGKCIQCGSGYGYHLSSMALRVASQLQDPASFNNAGSDSIYRRSEESEVPDTIQEVVSRRFDSTQHDRSPERQRSDCFDILCPITLNIMEQPVAATDGRSYERSAILQWFASSGKTESPLTKQYIAPTLLVTNFVLLHEIVWWHRHNPEQSNDPIEYSSSINISPEKLINILNDAGKVDEYGDTHLLNACLCGYYDPAASLISSGAHVNHMNGNKVTALHAASGNGYEDIVRLLLDHGAAVDQANVHDMTPLYLACQAGQTDTVRLLIEHNAFIDQKDNIDCVTPLWIASRNGHLHTARILLENGANVNVEDKQGLTPVYVALQNGFLEIFKALEKRGADPLNTALIIASENGHLDIVKYLIQHGIKLDVTNRCKNTALHGASEYGRLEVVNYLLDAGAPLELRKQDGSTPLTLACIGNHLAVALQLIDKGKANIDNQDSTGKTALHAVAFYNHAAIATLLIDRQASMDITNKNGDTPLHTACAHGSGETVAYMLHKDCTGINARNHHGNTPMMAASANGHITVVQQLMTSDADVDIQNDAQTTALIMASSRGHINVVRCLLKISDSIDVCDSEGNSALLAAIRHNHADIAQMLIENGAYLGKIGAQGYTPLYIASVKGNVEVVQKLILRKQQMDLREVDFQAFIDEDNTLEENTAIYGASFKGNTEVVGLLIQHGASVNKRQYKGHTALHVASFKGYISVVTLLLDNGALVNAEDNNRCTPLHNACEAGNLMVVRLLTGMGAIVDAHNDEGYTPLDIAMALGHGVIVTHLLSVVNPQSTTLV